MKRILFLVLILFFSCNTKPRNSIDIPNFDSNKAFTYLVKQCEFGPRNPGSSGHLEFSNYLETFLSELEGNLIIQEFIYTEPITNMERNGKNFIIQFNENAEYRLLLGAHWDTRSLSDQDEEVENQSLPVLGANDGASGTSVLMELATIISEKNPEIGIDIVFFDAEDGGFSGQPETFALGSRFFAENLPIVKPNFAIIVDMVGDKNLSIPIERISYNIAPEKVKEIWNLAEELSLPAFKKTIDLEIYDDHVPLWEVAAIPAIDIIDFQYPNMFYNHWHTQRDTPENCSPQSLGQVGNLLVNYIYGSDHK
ncbi:MAG: M28 family peptidase [Candidatus Neomarinimicrobiota bacterium]